MAMRGTWSRLTSLQRCASKSWQLRCPGRRRRKVSHTAFQSLTFCQLPNYKLARKSPEVQRGSTFPFVDKFEVSKGEYITSDDIGRLLLPLIGEERQQRFDRVVANRTFNVLPIVEGLYDMGNLAAVFRSADALGFGAVHCIKSKKYKQSKRASGGAEKWLDVQLWEDSRQCLTAAKDQGYQVVATHLSPSAVDISQVDWTRPTAVVLGNEKEGVSEATLELADQHVVVPMVGFVESFNVSVAAALILYQARATRLQKLGHHGDLSDEERRILKALMLLRNKGQTNEVVRNLLARPPPDWQIHRGGGDWGDKFGSEPLQPSEKRCHYWDGERCYGEELLYPGGKSCTHASGHLPGVSTLNKQKLRQMCQAKGAPLPGVLLPNKGGGQARGGKEYKGNGEGADSSVTNTGTRGSEHERAQTRLEEQLSEVSAA